jgi:hypothetical protein
VANLMPRGSTWVVCGSTTREFKSEWRGAMGSVRHRGSTWTANYCTLCFSDSDCVTVDATEASCVARLSQCVRLWCGDLPRLHGPLALVSQRARAQCAVGLARSCRWHVLHVTHVATCANAPPARMHTHCRPVVATSMRPKMTPLAPPLSCPPLRVMCPLRVVC